MIHIEVLLTEHQLAEEFIKALAARSLPEKFFYWLPLSVKAWLDLCTDGEYKNFTRSLFLIESHAKEIVSLLPPCDFEVLSLGAGQGIKDILLLKTLRDSGRKALYRPVDASQSLLEFACKSAVQDGFECTGIKADIARLDHLTKLEREDKKSDPRFVLLLGNTLGAFDPLEYCRHLKQILRPQDYLMVDGEIFGGKETMAGYDNLLNRRFAFAPLRSIGIDEADGELRFEARDDNRMAGLHFISKHFRPARDLDIPLSVTSFKLMKDERLDMNFSYKYSLETFRRLLEENTRLRILVQHISDDKRFCLVLASPVGKE